MEVRRYEPDVSEFQQLQTAFLRRALLFGGPAFVTLLSTFVFILAWTFMPAPIWLLFLLTLPAFFGAIFQIAMLWVERPSISVDAVAVEVGDGLLRFVNEEAGTVEEVRWKEGKNLHIARKNDCVEITFPSGRRSRVHWFAYSEREQLLKDLMQLKEGSVAEPAKSVETKEAAKTSARARKDSVADRE